jgi:hypothetical protein
MKLFSSFFLFCLLAINFCFAEKVIWKGEVCSDGSPTKAVHLVLQHNYQIRVSGVIKLGKWVQEGEELANDACYEFGKEKHLEKYESVINSLNISVCTGEFNQKHVYLSHPFIARQDRIHFWVNDVYYADNQGCFTVEIIELDK